MNLTTAPACATSSREVVVAMEGLMGSSPSDNTGTLFSTPLVMDNEPNRHGAMLGSALLKRPTSSESEEQDWRHMKMTKTESFLPSKPTATPCLLRSNTHSLFPDGQQMLSFSQSQPPPSSTSPKQDALFLSSDGSLPYYYLPPSSAMSSSSAVAGYLRSSGVGAGNLNMMNLHGTVVGTKGYFTPSQWVELEHQVMISRCLDANAPIPPSLLIYIRKCLYPSTYTAYSNGSLRPATYGWGSFQLGFSGNTDPEPGRCRRTDGKKWRCTRDAVVDQKYCERHLNRGRHRSRKPVEGQTGHAKMTVITRSPASLAASGSGSSNCSSAPRKHLKNFQPASTDPSPMQNNGISTKDEMNETRNLSFTTTTYPEPNNARYAVLKQHNPFEKATHGTEFALDFSGSLLDNSRNSFMENSSYALSSELKNQSFPLTSFLDEWPDNQSSHVTIAWPDTKDDPFDRTQLSISIPIPSGLPSSTTPLQDKTNYSLKLSQGFDPIHMSLGMGDSMHDAGQKQMNMVPISWEASMGGPLGEVLNNTCSNLMDTVKNSPLLNLTTNGWDSTPPESSPTGVLQKTTFSSLSSSTGSSPRIKNYSAHESTGGLHDHLLVPSL